MLLGVVTGVAGGILRDVLTGEVPLVFQPQIYLYATAALAGAAAFVLLNLRWPNQPAVTMGGAALILALRLAGMWWKLSLPVLESTTRENPNHERRPVTDHQPLRRLQSRRPRTPHAELVGKALFVARRLRERASELQTPSERKQQAELDRMLHTPSDKSTLTQITDQAFRARDPHRAVNNLIHLLDVQGIPRFFHPWDRTAP